jgi:hypothetical protein
MSQDIVGVNLYLNSSLGRNSGEDYSTVFRGYNGDEGVLYGLTVKETSPQSARVQITKGTLSINCGDEEFLTFSLRTDITDLDVPNTGIAKYYLVCFRLDISSATSSFVVVEGTAGTDPDLTEATGVFYLPIARIEHTGASNNITNAEIVQDGVEMTNNANIETIYKAIDNTWRQIGDPFSYVSPTVMTVEGDKTGMYQEGTRFRFTQNNVIKQVEVRATTYVSPTTTIMLTGDALTNHPILNTYVNNSLKPVGIDSVGYGIAKNWIIDGSFQDWQDGQPITPTATNQYVATMWKTNYSVAGTGVDPTIIYTRGRENGHTYMNINVNGAGASYPHNAYHIVTQHIYNSLGSLCPKQVTLKFRAKSNIANKKIGYAIEQYYGTGGTPSTLETIQGAITTLTSDWQDIQYTFTTSTLSGKTLGTNNDNAILVHLFTQWGSTVGTKYFADSTPETFVGAGDIMITDVQVVIGNKAGDFVEDSLSEIDDKVSPFYEKTYNRDTKPGTAQIENCVRVYTVSTSSSFHRLRWRTRKIKTPTFVWLYSASTGLLGKMYSEGTSLDVTLLNAGTFLQYGELGVPIMAAPATIPASTWYIFHYVVDVRP